MEKICYWTHLSLAKLATTVKAIASLAWQWLLTHWGRVTHICVSKIIIIGSDNGLSPGRCQAIVWTNADILWIRPLGITFSDECLEIHTFSFTNMRLKMSSVKWRPFCLGLNVLKVIGLNNCSTDAVWKKAGFVSMQICSSKTSFASTLNLLFLNWICCDTKPALPILALLWR